MSDSALTDKACLTALVAGTATGLLSIFFNGLIQGGLLDLSPAKWQLLTVLFLALLAGFGTFRMTRVGLQGIAGRLGIRAGLYCALAAGAAINLIATLNAIRAGTTALESALKARMWLAFAVSLAAVLPAVLCGFAGGLIGSRHRVAKPSEQNLPSDQKPLSWLRWAILGVLIFSFLGLLAPLSFLGRASKVDPVAAIVKDSAPSFHYQIPPDIESTKIGEIQPDITKVIEGIQTDGPMSLSANGRLLAYCDTSSGSPAISVYDLNHFQKITSIQVPAFPQESLAWSPDQKSLACTILNNSSRLIWILRIAEARATSLPRPPGRDTPGGEVFWWQAQELVFFPTDESPLVFDLEKLLLKSIDDSTFFSKLNKDAKRQWKDGPRTSLPSQKGWKLDVRTVITSAVPPPRRSPEKDWELFGNSICSMSHPDLPLAFGFASLVVDENTKVLCAADGSKLIRLKNGRAEVTYMRKSAAPTFHFEVSMPSAVDVIKEDKWKRHVTDGELCLLVCAPLVNPLNHQVVGPDFQQVRGIAQLVEWKDHKAVFVMQIYGRPIHSTDIASTLHAWSDGHKNIWNEETVKDWWSAITPVARELPETLPDLYMPTHLAFNADESPSPVVKATERHRPVPQAPAPSVALNSSPLSQSPFSMLGSASAANSALFSQGTSSVTSPASVSHQLTETDVKEFIVAHHDKAAQGRVPDMVADYDQTVDFLDKGRLSRDAIQAEETAQRQKWPRGSEKILGPVTVSKDGGLWKATYSIQFHNENTMGEWILGQADLTITMTSNMGRLIIISQKAKVHAVTSSKK